MHEDWGLYLTISILIVVGLFFWLLFDSTKEFGLNFFTEMLGVLVTVLVIEKLLQNREKDRLLPQQMVVYEDVRLFVSRYISFWTTTYRESVPEGDPKDLEELFSESGMPKILKYLHMDSEPNVTPPRKWWDWIVYNAKEFSEAGDKILDRHAHILEPAVYALVHQLTESSFNKLLLMIPGLKQSDSLRQFPRVKVLGSYSMPPQKEDFEAILGLVDWCESQYKKFKDINPSVKRVSLYNPSNDKNMPPKCQIPDEILRSQMSELNEFRNKNK